MRLADFSARIEIWLEYERDRLALWLPVALGCGIAAWFALSTRLGWAVFIALTLGAGAMILALAGPGRASRALASALILSGIGCGLVWARASHVESGRLARPAVLTVSGRIEAVEQLAARDKVRLLLKPDPAAQLPGLLRINLETRKAPDWLAPGQRIAVRARLAAPPGPAVPGAYDFARIAWFKGISGVGRALDPPRLLAPAHSEGISDRIASWRARLTTAIHRRLPGPEGGVAAAFVTGDQGAITEDDADAMRVSGLAHLLSISGLHVGVVIGGVMLLTLRLLAASPVLALRLPLPAIAAGAGALAGIAYTLLAGAEVPTLRSCIAALLILAALMMGREAITLRLVGTAAVLVLLFRPEALVGPSFQLSFAAVVTIVALHELPLVRHWLERREEGALPRFGRAMLGLLLTGLAIEIVLAPIALFHFHRAGLYGALANMVAIPLTSFWIMPAEALALLLDIFGWGAPAWWLAGQGIAVLLGLARHVAAWPMSSALLPAMPVMAYALIVLGGLWLMLWARAPRLLGLVPLGIGLGWAIAVPPPDLLVTGDGRHLALRDGTEMRMLRERAGDYVREALGEIAATPAVELPIDAAAGARCSTDLCLFDISGSYRLLAIRSAYRLDREALERACHAVDIVVADRRLPRGCQPHWLRLDPARLAHTGGVAIYDGGRRLVTARSPRDAHPWVLPAAGPGPSAGSRVWPP